jgi:hypothetical protein
MFLTQKAKGIEKLSVLFFGGGMEIMMKKQRAPCVA